jgi:5,10-methylenetetrahydrofolate reductase
MAELAKCRQERAVVLVGAPARDSQVQLRLSEAYAIASKYQPELMLGGIAIAERHAQRGDEHERLLGKMRRGCRFFVTQAVYDVTASKSLLSDFRIALDQRAEDPVPLILTFSPCASEKTLAFMKWLGISFPRWLENELRLARDPLATSLDLCQETFEQIQEFARQKSVPVGVNVESVSIRKAEIDASMELLSRLRAKLGAA